MKKILILCSFILLPVLQCLAQIPEIKPKEISILLRYQTYPLYTRIVLEGDEEILKESKISRAISEPQFLVEFKKTVSVRPSTLSIKDGMVKSVEFVEKGNKKILNINLEKEPYDHKSFLLKDPPRRVLDIYKGPIISSNPKTTIVIDPGHGGAELGAVGQSGLNEKALALDIALRLKAILQKNPDIRVILTRNSDFSLPLRERAFIGNSNKANIFISIHANNSFGKSKRNFVIYLLQPPETKGREHKQPYLWDRQHEKAIKESSRLAESIKEGLKKSRGEDVPIKEAPLLELKGVEAPSVFIEIPMSSEDEKSLQKEPYKNKIASDISIGILNYLKKRAGLIEEETIW